MSSCPDDRVFAALVDGELSEPERENLISHIDACPSCRKIVAELGRDASVTIRAGDSVPTPVALPLEAERSIGRYVILEMIGAGGMGKILRAYDPKLRREVALKALRSESLGHEAEARLIREARAMAQLRHPNVVAVYDVEVEPASVVIVMEYVPGSTLAHWLLAAPRSWEEVVATFCLAGRGLAAAHVAGLVHRDFKPANVLVADDGRVEVTDFGLAKIAIDDDAQSQADAEPRAVEPLPASASSTDSLSAPLTVGEMVLGTPRYMAPEQHTGKRADARSDQYAFCVALWEALCGEPPFAQQGHALWNAKMDGPPDWPRASKAPTRIAQAIRRGLSPAPQDRWPGMHELLEVLADGPGARRRRRLGWLAVGVSSASAIAAFVGWSLSQPRPCTDSARPLQGVWDGSRREELREALLASALPYAQRTWPLVEARLDGYAEQWTEQHREACEDTVLRKVQSETVMDLRMACLWRSKMQLRAAVDVLAQADQTVVARALYVVADLPNLTRCQDVEALGRDVAPPADGALALVVERHREALAAARSLTDAGKYEQARALIDPLAPEIRALGYPPLLAEAMLVTGDALSKLGHYDEALAAHHEAFRLSLELGMHELASTAAARLAFALGVRREQPAEARWLAEVALAMARYDQPDGRLELGAHNVLGTLADVQGEYDRAEDELRRAIEIGERALSPDHPALVSSRNNLALVLESRGQLGEAEAEYRHMIALREETVGSKHPDVATLRMNLANVLGRQRRPREAAIEATAAVDLFVELYGPQHPELAAAHNALANALQAQGDRERAEAEYRRAIALHEHYLGPEHFRVAGVRSNLVNLLLEQGRFVEAERELRALIELVTPTLGDEHPELAPFHYNLGRALLGQQQHEAGEAQLRRAADLWERGLGPDHPHVATASLSLATLLLEQGRRSEALVALERAWAIHAEAEVPSHVRADNAFVLARALWDEASTRSREHDAMRTRAVALAKEAAATYALEGDDGKGSRAEVEIWLSEHPGTR